MNFFLNFFRRSKFDEAIDARFKEMQAQLNELEEARAKQGLENRLSYDGRKNLSHSVDLLRSGSAVMAKDIEGLADTVADLKRRLTVSEIKRTAAAKSILRLLARVNNLERRVATGEVQQVMESAIVSGSNLDLLKELSFKAAGKPVAYSRDAATVMPPVNWKEPIGGTLCSAPDTRRFSCVEFFNERMPSWAFMQVPTVQKFTNAVDQAAKRDNVKPELQRTKYRNWTRTWPVNFLKKVTRDTVLDLGGIVPGEERDSK